MGWLKGITVTLYEKTETGKDPLGDPIYKETPVEVNNVLVSPVSTSDITEDTNIDGRKLVYTLAIPKGDTHIWENRRVNFFERDWRVSGCPQEGIEGLVPLSWNKKVQVESYE